MKKIRTEPRASSLIESMRDLGYSLETALADIVDNSIAASAKQVDIFFESDDIEISICIVDDGHGMTPDELFEAMRPGSISPLEQRSPGDLGRFGLGLKTASFSQCRKLTVLTRKKGILSCARWDLDSVVEEDEWLLQVLDADEIERISWLSKLGKTGTIVLWENLDRLTDKTSGANLKDHLYDSLDEARRYLGLLFHRFLDGERPFPKLTLKINERKVDAFDPFNTRHPATQTLPEEICRVEGHKIKIQPFILPHHKKCTRSEYERYAGQGGYLRNQGFYVYRMGRLIIHRTWFKITRQSELTRLARVRVDIPGELDHLWKIDVRKASAQPPFAVRQRLKTISDRITGASGRVYTFKGHKLRNLEINSLWVRKTIHNEILYEINRDHPVIRHFVETIGEEKASTFNALIKAVESCFPADAFFADAAGNSEALAGNQMQEDTMEMLLEFTLEAFKEQGLTMPDVVGILEKTDPFRNNMKTVHIILESKERQNHGY